MKKDTALLVPLNGKIEVKNCKDYRDIVKSIGVDWLATSSCTINGMRFTIFCDDCALLRDELPVPTIYTKRGKAVLFGSCILAQIEDAGLDTETLTLPDNIMSIIDQNILTAFDWDGKQFIAHEVLIVD